MDVSLNAGLAEYSLPAGDKMLPLKNMTGRHISLKFLGLIRCIHCDRKINKSFNQGYCYPCFIKLAQCDRCIMKPELCHYHKGTCREPEWGESFCMTDHIVYLANSSGVKVGITRANHVPMRWIDQGAIQALSVFRVATRQLSGFIEDLFRQEVSDKTNWQTMLKGQIKPVDLLLVRDNLFKKFQTSIEQLQEQYGINKLQPLIQKKEENIAYPVDKYPTKIVSFNFDKTPLVEGSLLGIKGQYLILDSGVINIRKFTGYHVSVDIRA